jgi:hypothetical protein
VSAIHQRDCVLVQDSNNSKFQLVDCRVLPAGIQNSRGESSIFNKGDKKVKDYSDLKTKRISYILKPRST